MRSRRVLLEGVHPVRLSGRAYDLLLALVDRAGTVVDKRELIALVWPNTVVEETNLRVHIKALRRALGEADKAAEGYILNVPGRGYSFIGTPIAEAGEPQPDEPLAATEPRNTLPAPLTRMVGRAATLAALVQLVPQRRLVTIVGLGGVGKSTLALEVATQLADSYPDGSYFVHLAAITSASLVATTIATEIGLALSTQDPISSLATFLRHKRMLLVLDNCEHVIAAVAGLAEALLRRTERLSILATSREPLGAEGEWQSRLQPLPIPPENSTSAAEAQTYGAVELFVDRAATRGYAFTLTDANAPLLCDICRRLDGIPLAIELVAARLDVLGIQDLASRLNDRFVLSAGGRRTAAPRHQTIRAALEWSHELLTDTERTVLRRLSAFKGSFTVDSAVAVAAHGRLDGQTAFDAVMSLTEKSLVTTEVSEQSARHRLLHTTRAYAYEKLAESPDLPHIWRWHAEHHVDLLRSAEAEWERMSRTAWVRRFGPSIDDVRAALDAAFAPAGDVPLGAELAIAAVPFGFQLALQDELRERIETALRLLAESDMEDGSLVARLDKAWKTLSLDARRLDQHAAPSVISSTARLEAAERADNPLGAIVTEAALEIEAGRYDAAVRKAQQAAKVAQTSDDPMAVVLSERILAQTMHFRGQHAAARVLARKVLGQADKAIPLAHQPLSVDHRVSMRIVLARIAWIEGSFYQARQIADESLEYAADDSPFSLCQALALAACPIAFWQGDYARARSLTARLLEEASRYRLGYWHTHGEWYERLTNATQEPIVPSGPFPLSGLLLDTLTTINPGLVSERDKVPARETGSWCAPELLRVQGERLLKAAAPQAATKAEALFSKALEIARAQGALAWELRAATSLAASWSQRGLPEQAHETLSAVRARIDQDYDSRDMVKARELQEQLG